MYHDEEKTLVWKDILDKIKFCLGLLVRFIREYNLKKMFTPHSSKTYVCMCVSLAHFMCRTIEENNVDNNIAIKGALSQKWCSSPEMNSLEIK